MTSNTDPSDSCVPAELALRLRALRLGTGIAACLCVAMIGVYQYNDSPLGAQVCAAASVAFVALLLLAWFAPRSPLLTPTYVILGATIINAFVAIDGGATSPLMLWIPAGIASGYVVGGRAAAWGAVAAYGTMVVVIVGFDLSSSGSSLDLSPEVEAWRIVWNLIGSGVMVVVLVGIRESAWKAAIEAKNHAERERITAQAENRSKAAFLASVSHEIRTPLNGILGTIEILGTTSLEPHQREHLDVIGRSGQILLSILNDVLDSAKIDSGTLEITEEAVDPSLLIDEVLRLFTASVSNREIELRHERHPSLPAGLWIDPHRLQQVVMNLVSNACKFTERGEVVVSQRVEHGRWHIDVRDSGIGIAPDRLDAIFEPFVQADDSTSRRFGGTGLGLSICRQLITLMGGTLHAESELGQGSAFCVTLPAQPARLRPKTPPRGVTIVPADPLLILVAEDNPVNQRVIRLLLEREGHHVEIVDNGRDAVSSCARTRFDVVLLDVQMPIMDGLEAARALREEPSHHDLTLIAITANAFPEDRRRAKKAGMAHFLPKPINTDELRGLLATVEGRQRLAS